jgi:protein FrlC
MKIGNTSGVYLNYPIDEAIRRTAAAGFDGIDVWSGRPHVYRGDIPPAGLRELRQLATDEGLEVSSFLPAFHRYPYTLSSPNDTVREDSVQYMKECMDNAVLLGSPVLLVVPEKTLYGQTVEDAWDRLADSIGQICDYARQYAIHLGIEPVNHYVSDMINTAADAMRMIDQLGFDNLGIVLDTQHISLSRDEDSRQAVERCGDRLLQAHVSDNDGVHQQNLVPGEGVFDFADFVQVLRDHGYDGYLSSELGYHYTHDPDPAVRKTAGILRELLR